ncbi:mitochondrial import protein Pam17 [Scheffersomyces coipomensis]|uniref:mitochondrial import protein Pam17 n=1 Tax=Scheffersomyces coipomensis TaxID=1788519 RepID=UPI00315CED20
MLTNQLGIFNRVISKNSSALFKQSGNKIFQRLNSTKVNESFSWQEYFKLKKQKNFINFGASSITGLGGVLITLGAIANIEFDEKPMFGFDPVIVLSTTVILGGGIGYLFGPTFGSSLFKLSNRRILHQFNKRDQQFLARIKDKRVDPSSQSFSNPVPDYYGEKIYSLNDYKQWLRDCNAFRRKAKEFL